MLLRRGSCDQDMDTVLPQCSSRPFEISESYTYDCPLRHCEILVNLSDFLIFLLFFWFFFWCMSLRIIINLTAFSFVFCVSYTFLLFVMHDQIENKLFEYGLGILYYMNTSVMAINNLHTLQSHFHCELT